MLSSTALKIFLKEQKETLYGWKLLSVELLIQIAFILINIFTTASWPLYQIILPVALPGIYLLAANVLYIWPAVLTEKAEYYDKKAGN